MAKLQRLATKEDDIVGVHNPLTEEDLKDRKQQYQILSDKEFAFRYNLEVKLFEKILYLSFGIVFCRFINRMYRGKL